VLTCFACTVRAECEDFRARTGSEYGVWGGQLRKRNAKDGEPEDDD